MAKGKAYVVLHHFFLYMVLGRMTWDSRRPSNIKSEPWGNKLLNLYEAKIMAMLTIESSLMVTVTLLSDIQHTFIPRERTRSLSGKSE